MSDETGEQDAPGGSAGETPEPVPAAGEAGPPPAETTEPVAAAAQPGPGAPVAGAAEPVAPAPVVTTTTVETTNGSGRPGWLTAVLAGIAVLVLLGAGFGIGRWTDNGGGDHFRFSNGRGFPGGRGFARPGFGPNGNGSSGPSFGPNFNGPNGNGNGPRFGNGNGFGGRNFGPNRNNQNNQNGSNGSGNSSTNPQTTSPLQ